MKIGFIFPGQGAQFPGMGKDLYDASAQVRELFAIASDVAHKDIPKLVFEGTEADLQQTDNTQIAMTAVNLAARLVLNEHGLVSTQCAGFSLGEYACMVDAGIITAADAFHLVLHRGAIMERVSRSLDTEAGPAGMIAAMGLDLPQVQEALTAAGVQGVHPALYNSPVQIVLGGTAAGMAAATDVLKAAGCKRVVALRVSAPFHTPLLEPARVEFEPIINAVTYNNPVKRMLSNVTAAPVESGSQMRGLSLRQFVDTVLWTDEERAFHADGVELLLEVGPGSVLTNLWKTMGKSDPDWPVERCRTAGTLAEIEAIAAEVAK